MTVERANLNDQSRNVDNETTVPKVQINRCVVETPDNSVTDRFDDCSPVMLCLDKVNQPVMGDKDNVSVRAHKVDHANNTALSQTQDTPTCVQRIPLTYIHVMIGNSGPYRCMSDSGTELAIAKESVVWNISPPVQKQGQIKLQGIFDEAVLADLVNLPISLFDPNAADQVGKPVPLMFAITNAVVQDCDLIIPALTLNALQNSSMRENEPTSADISQVNVVTRSQAEANKQSVSGSKEPQSDQFCSACDSEQQLSNVNKKAQLTLTKPHDSKGCKNCSNSTCFVSFHRIPFPQISNCQ